MRLKGKVILVTGGSGLIGRELIKAIKSEGSICINADVQVETDWKNGIVSSDITNPNNVKDLIVEILNRYGRIDGLVNNAYPRTGDWGDKFEDIKFESWQKNVDMQLNSTFLICQLVLEQMKKQGSGSVVNFGSIYGVVGNDFSIYEGFGGTSPAAYAAIKGGIINFTKYLASYYGKYGVRINAVSPGGILDKQHPSFIERYESKVPLKRLGKPFEIAPPVCFLLSDESSYITGHNLMVDGGWSII